MSGIMRMDITLFSLVIAFGAYTTENLCTRPPITMRLSIW